jgi:hemerythrin-like domain-containing protein
MSPDPEGGIDARLTRRAVIGTGSAGLILAAGVPASPASHSGDEGVTAPEDLMKEHGVLNRCLLIYEEGMRLVQARKDVSPQVFHRTAELVRRFVEEYHEKNEEKYIFPVFQKAGKLTELVETLLTQHKVGRLVTARLFLLSQPNSFKDPGNRARVVSCCQSFIRMYRPHASREDTLLFPALRTILEPKQVAALGARMEEDEHKVLGDEGFEKSVAEVSNIEKGLGIYDLNQFTPKL